MDHINAKPAVAALSGIAKIAKTLPSDTEDALNRHVITITEFINAHLEFYLNALNSEAALMEIWEKRLLAIEKQLNPHK